MVEAQEKARKEKEEADATRLKFKKEERDRIDAEEALAKSQREDGNRTKILEAKLAM